MAFCSFEEDDVGGDNIEDYQDYDVYGYKSVITFGLNDVISQSEYEQLVKDNPKLITELQLSLVNQSIVNESRELWDTIKGPVFKYVVPGLQLTGGVAQLGLAAGIDVAGCATVVGCGIAVVGSSYFIVNGSDDIATAIANFGKEPLKQTNSFVLTNNGVDEETAGNIKLGAGIVSLVGEAAIINQGAKVATGTVENVANKSNDLMDSSTTATSETNVPDYVTRNDHDFSSTENYKGKPKAYIDEKGDLVAANPDGTGSIQSHIRGGNESNTPYISTTDPKSTLEAKDYGGQQIEIDTKRLQEDINLGKLPNTQIVTHQKVKEELQMKIDEAQIKYDNNPTDKNQIRLDKAKADLDNAIRDGECLIKGCVPSDYFKIKE